jgi:hypothetical protein
MAQGPSLPPQAAPPARARFDLRQLVASVSAGAVRMAAHDPEAAAAFHLIMARLLSDRVVHLIETVDALQR